MALAGRWMEVLELELGAGGGACNGRGCTHKKLASFRHKTQKFFFLAGSPLGIFLLTLRFFLIPHRFAYITMISKRRATHLGVCKSRKK